MKQTIFTEMYGIHLYKKLQITILSHHKTVRLQNKTPAHKFAGTFSYKELQEDNIISSPAATTKKRKGALITRQ